jgi:hypothetical protein
MPLHWLIILGIGFFALKNDSKAPAQVAGPAPANPNALPAGQFPLDAHMDPHTLTGVWGAYYRCVDADYLTKFSVALMQAGFPMGASLLRIRAAQLAPAAKPQEPKAEAKAEAPANGQDPLLKRALDSLSPEQRAAYYEALATQERAKIPAKAPAREALPAKPVVMTPSESVLAQKEAITVEAPKGTA